MSFAWHEIHDRLMHSSSTLRFQRGFDAIRRAGPPLAAFREPAALLDALHGKAAPRERKNAVLAALVAAAQRDGAAADCALTLILLALWPGLDAIRRRSLRRGIGLPDDVTADLLARTTEAVRCLDLGRVTAVAATILMNIERDMVRARRRDASRERRTGDADPDGIAADGDAPDDAIDAGRLVAEMHRAVGADAALVIRVALEGLSQAEIAVELGLTEAAARKRHQRATRRLRNALQKNVDALSRSAAPDGFYPSDAAERPIATEGQAA